MKRPIPIALSAAAILGAGLASGQGPADSVDAKTRKSTFVFSGTIKQTKASNVKDVAASDSTAIVTIDQVYKSSKVMSRLGGRDVTVLLDQAPGLPPVADNHKATFFTQAVSYGANVAVKEVAPREPPRLVLAPGAKAVGTEVLEAVANHSDDAMKAHLTEAATVVFGTVESTAAIERKGLTAVMHPEGQPRRPVTEHYPEWHVATVRVGSVLKGKPALEKVGVVFAKSTDIAWHTAPKFVAGQVGTFLLHDDQVKDPALKKALLDEAARLAPGLGGYLFALAPDDFQPKLPDATNVQRVQRLLKLN